MQITKHICPKNCFSACGMIAFVDKRGQLVKVAGDSNHNYSQGKLCCKGYAYPHYVYNPGRILYPMLQSPRFSGQWKRLSWTDALDMIGRKVIELNHRYSSFLPIALLKGSGNHGILAEAAEIMFRSLGSVTRIAGSLCLSAGWDAQLLDFGGIHNQDPGDMEKASLLILWGVNPSATAIHQIPIINKTRRNGGQVVLIDVIRTETAKYADEFIQVRPGGDGALALSLLQRLVEWNKVDYSYIRRNTIGWEPFCNWLLQTDFSELQGISGVSLDTINRLAKKIARGESVAFWPGAGMQRYANGGQNMRAINALVAASGNLKKSNGGIFFQNIDFWRCNYRVFKEVSGLPLHDCRLVGLNSLAHNLAKCDDPPVKLLWVSSSNIMARGSDLAALQRQFARMELVVTVDHFMTPTVQASDLVLPATTCFESPDIVISYWHNQIGFNQQAIQPIGECRSDLEIVSSLSHVLNTIKPGVSPFPQVSDDEFWLDQFSSWLESHTSVSHYRDLLGKVKPVNLSIFTENTDSNKFRFQALGAIEQHCPEIPILAVPLRASSAYPFRFLVLHSAENTNSQFANLEWISGGQEQDVLISPQVANAKGIATGDVLILYNEQGEIRLKAKIRADIPDDILVCYTPLDLGNQPVNQLATVVETDLGQALTEFKGIAYHDTFVNIIQG